jgi:prevent-host-death family protein
VTTTGLRELRQQASELVRQAEAGETITVTVSGRAVAELGPVRPHRWRRGSDIGEIFRGAADGEWTGDRERLDDTPTDPFRR